VHGPAGHGAGGPWGTSPSILECPQALPKLWTDFEFEDGAKARGLAKLPTGVKDLLKELLNSAKRHGGLHAAAGDLRMLGKDSIRLALLEIIFKSVGLPGDGSCTDYARLSRQLLRKC
jgi:hypothetical protein